MKKKVLLLLTVFFIYGINAQEKALSTKIEMNSPKIPIDPSVKIGKLSNGLTYYIKNNGKPANKVELRLVINAGSILEDDDQLGLAHFMEHMNFNGTKNFKKNELVDYLQSIGVKFGAHLNAYTGFDETVYILPIPSDNEEKLEKGFQILEDWAHGALIKGKDVDEERGVILEEYRSRRDANSRMLQKYLPKVLYGSKYAERLPIGTKKNIETFKHKSLRRFYKDWYRPDLMAVIAVGDVDVATLEKKIKSHFGKIPAAKKPRERNVSPLKNHKETFIAIESDKESPFSRVQLMYKDHGAAKAEVTVSDYKKSVIKSLFAQMLNNRLDEVRNSEVPPFVYGFSYHGGTWARGKNAYQSMAGTSAEGQLKGLEALLDENERVKRFGFKQGELDRAKKNVISRLETSFKNRDKRQSGRIIGEYVNNYLQQEPIPGIAWEFKAQKHLLPSIQLADVNRLIKNYLHDDNRVVVITGPKKVVTEQQVINALKNVKTKKLTPYEDKVVASSLITTPPTSGKIVDFSKNDKLGTKTFILSNGAKVTYKKTDFKNDEVLFTAFSFGGTSLYSLSEYKATALANGALAQAGVNNFSKIDLSKMMSGKIARVNPFIGAYSEGFNGSASPKDLETMFQLVHLYFTSLNKDEKAFRSHINKQKSFIGNLLANPNFYFQNEMGNFTNGKNPRYLGFPTPKKYDAADYNLAYRKYLERFADAGDFNFYFVGNIDERKLAEYAMKYLAGLPSKNSKETYKVSSFRPLSGSHSKTVIKGKEPKSNVRITYQGEAIYNKKEALAFKSLGEIVSIKLIEKLREKEAGVYSSGTRGSIRKFPYGSYNFSISFPCAPENVEKLKNISIAQVADIVKNGPTKEDLMKTKKAQIIEYKESLKKNRFWLSLIKNIDYQKIEAPDVSSFETRINALTRKDIQNVAKKYLTKGYILGILNPEK
jgi:zinc protease